MISTAKLFKRVALIIAILFCVPNVNAQLIKKLKKSAERTVEPKIEQKVDRETSKGMDSILNPNDKSSKKNSPDSKPNKSPLLTQGDNSTPETNNPNVSDNIEIYSKFDFVPGDKPIYFDDFSQDFIGDFPSKWNTNGSGEVVKLNKAEGNWFEIKAGYGIYYMPLVNEKLPEEYTIEFDLFTEGLGSQTSSTARFYITLDDNDGFNRGRAYAFVTIPFGQYGSFGIQVTNTDPSSKKINATVTADVRKAVVNKPHISIAVNKKRFRLWVNEKKYIDVPQFIFDPVKIGYLKFNLQDVKDGEERIFMKNLKIAKGGLDLRRQLMAEGKVSTNGILFDSGSANIKSQSYGIIRQISQVLMQDGSMNLNIIGHTDSDVSDDANLKLSKIRAEAVKNALITVYKISEERLQAEGKGESEPVSENQTVNRKSQNRRVEFIKQ